MAYIPPSRFTMGSPESEPARLPAEGPQTQVTITRGFCMGKYEVSHPNGRICELSVESRPSAMDCGGMPPLWLHDGRVNRPRTFPCPRPLHHVGKAVTCPRSPRISRLLTDNSQMRLTRITEVHWRRGTNVRAPSSCFRQRAPGRDRRFNQHLQSTVRKTQSIASARSPDPLSSCRS